MAVLTNADAELAARLRLTQFGSCASVGADSNTGFDPWFPLSGFDDDAQAAKRICASCPVQDDCLAVALTFNEDFGIWGGLTAAERRALAIAIPTRNEVLDDLVVHAVCVPAG